jgi:hypothetical protein
VGDERMTDTVEILDSTEDWKDFLSSCCKEQLQRLQTDYPKIKIIPIEFTEFFKFGEVGKRLAEEYLKHPNYATEAALDAIRTGRLVRVVKTFTPEDLKISIRNIPHGDLSEICTPNSQQCRTDSRTKAWRGAVRLRDEFRCRKCGISEESLEVHHIIPVNKDPSLAWDINNGITLCKRCHSKFHSEYGVYDLGHYEIHCFLRATICDEGDQS